MTQMVIQDIKMDMLDLYNIMALTSLKIKLNPRSPKFVIIY